MPLECGDARQEALAVETLGIQLIGRLVGGADHHHTRLEHDLEQAAQDDRIADIVDEQFIEAQHSHLTTQLMRQSLQRVGCATQLEQTLMHPAHKVMKMLAPRGDTQALIELVHQPGFTAPHRAP